MIKKAKKLTVTFPELLVISNSISNIPNSFQYLMVSPTEDLIELERIKQGDGVAFTRIYNLYSERVYGFAYRMLGVQATAEDVTHEAFLVLIKHPERYNSERGSVLTFLCAIVRNNVFHHFRKRGYEIEDTFDEQSPVVMNIESAADPLLSLLEQETATKVNEAIALLPTLQREVLVLREFQELSYEEISIVAGVEVNVVKARLHRARQTLAKRLKSFMNLKREHSYEVRRS